MIGFSEGPVHVSVLNFRPVCFIIPPFVEKPGRAFFERLLWVGDWLEWVVFDLNLLYEILGNISVSGNNSCDALSRVANLVDCQWVDVKMLVPLGSAQQRERIH